MIYPEEFPRNNRDFSSERILFQRFKKELGREFTVYYSVKFTTPDVPMREIDFLVISPRMILCVELKNGKWRYKDGKWEFYNRRSKSWEQQTNKPYNGPLDQIRSARKVLKDFLYHHNSFENPVSEEYFRSSIFFLKNEPGDFPINEEERKFFIGKSRLKNRKITMRDILVSLQNPDLPPLGSRTLANLHNIIRLNLNFASDIYSRRKNQSGKLIALTREQFQIVRREQDSPRKLVLGVPGSGKTIVATEIAFRMESMQATTLFVTNSPTAAKEISNLVRWFSVDFATPDTVQDLPDPYQCMILDSSEKYLNPEFLNAHKNALRGGWEKGEWTVLGDWHFSLKLRDYREALEILRKFSTMEVVWKQNIRTPRKVYEQACLLGRKEHEPGRLPDVTGIHYASYSSEEEMLRKLEWAILYGLRDLGLSKSGIVILSLDPKLTETIAKKSSVPLQNIQSAPLGTPGIHEESIAISNLEEFEGREAPYTIVLGISDFDDRSRFDDFYHALTRCTMACSLLYPDYLKEQLSRILKSD